MDCHGASRGYQPGPLWSCVRGLARRWAWPQAPDGSRGRVLPSEASEEWTRPFPCVHFIVPRAFYGGAPARPLFGLCRCDNAGERRRENAGSRGRRSSPAGPPSSVLTQTTSNTAGLVDTTEHVVSHRPVVGLGTAD